MPNRYLLKYQYFNKKAECPKMDTLSIFGHKIGHISICLYKNNSRDLTIDKVEFRLLFIDSKGNSYINE